MLCLRGLRSLARSTNPLPAPKPASSSSSSLHQKRYLTIPSLHRPKPLLPYTLSTANTPTTSPSPNSTTTRPVPPFTHAPPPLDLLPRISTHPSLANIQVRNGPRDTFNPSHRVRKRRHGFLSRKRTRNGRNTLKRRQLKGRITLSH